jgi:hypothetical protein
VCNTANIIIGAAEWHHSRSVCNNAKNNINRRLLSSIRWHECTARSRWQHIRFWHTHQYGFALRTAGGSWQTSARVQTLLVLVVYRRSRMHATISRAFRRIALLQGLHLECIWDMACTPSDIFRITPQLPNQPHVYGTYSRIHLYGLTCVAVRCSLGPAAGLLRAL